MTRAVAVFTAVSIGLLTSTLLIAAPEGAQGHGRTLFLSVAGERVRVDLPNATARYLLDPRNGDRLVYFSPEEATLIAQALEARGLGQRAPEVLLSLQYPREDWQPNLDRRHEELAESKDPAPAAMSQEAHCLHLELNGVQYRFDLKGGGPAYAIDPVTGERVVRFSAEDAKLIFDALVAAGHDTAFIMGVLFGLRDGNRPAHDPDAPTTETSKPQIILDPSCGHCQNGGLCGDSCCNYGGAGCQVCKVCG